MNTTDLQTLLIWLAGIGGPFVVGKALSLLAENWPQWHNLPSAVKFIIPMVASALLAVGATLLLQQQEFIALISPWFTIIAGAILGWLGTQQGYMEAKKSNYAEDARETAAEIKYEKVIDDHAG